MSWQSFVAGSDGAKRLASLQAAVGKMKSLDGSAPTSADFRRSWKYWANIHGYLGQNSKFKTVEFQADRLKNAQLSQFLPFLLGTADKPGFQNETPPDDIAKAVWATCQHSPQGQQLNFFGWHRMYLYYFERVLRWAANDASLTLPYWDYTDPAQTTLPDAFQDPQSPLYDWRRSEALNEGLSALNPQITDIDGPLSTDTSFLQYEGDIETGVHGNVHCSVGQTCPVAVMGLVGLAANDPIFYEHHANIDRMWSCWQHAHPNEQPGDWANDEFTFVDETGAKVTRKVKDFLETRDLGYVYDNDSKCTRTSTAMVAMNEALAKGGPDPETGSTTKPIRLNAATTSVTVAVPSGPSPQEQSATARTTLILKDVTAPSDPGALLNVLVAPKDRPNARAHVGTINWFGVFDPMDGMDHKAATSRTFTYDVSRQLNALGLTSADQLTVTFQAISGLVPSATSKSARPEALSVPPLAKFREGAEPTIGAIETK